MATQDVGPSDPAVLRLIERQNAALLQPAGLTSPPAVTGGQASSSSSSSNVRSLAPKGAFFLAILRKRFYFF